MNDVCLNNFARDVAMTLEVNANELTECFSLGKSQNWDSMGLVSVITLIDRHFKVYLDYTEVHNCKTYGDLLKLVQK